MPFEHHSKPLLPRKQFYNRVLRYTCFSFLLLGASLGIGVVGYHYLTHLAAFKG